MEKKKYYITTAIDYANAPPHVGHALEKVQADVLARYHRAKGFETFYLTGTDEHGVKVFRKAQEAGKEPQVFTDEIVESFKALKGALNLSWDDFIRTSDKERHWPGVELIWKKLVEAGDIYKKNYKGLYCVGCEKFITEKDLVDGKCRDHQREPEVVEEENYFFRLSKYSKEIELRIRNNELRIIPEGRANEILALISEGLEDVSFSRPSKDLPWGVPVPGDPSQTMYVWCDALTNYISALGYGRNEDWKKWWPADAQLIGKDILRFHAAIWPGMLLSAGLPLPKHILVHGFLTIEGAKMSKSVGNVIDPIELVKKYGTDALRYYFLKEVPSHEDGDFSVANLERVYNGELANGLGNFSARVLGLASKFGKFEVEFSKVETSVKEKIEAARNLLDKKIHEFKLHEAIGAINELISFGDKYVNDHEVWKEAESKKKEILNLVVILDNVAGLLKPFLPETAGKISQSIVWIDDKNLEVKKGAVLFPRL
ncbi:MAG: methionyl-tRNA synthetase [Parcubacteria group bacterium Gr01-1014_20]|nr:MAG: methionyl-tRNA synthetase [Parcubacteria group bacterium Gr01-1014_20]